MRQGTTYNRENLLLSADSAFGRRRLAAVLRIAFGVVWAVDAALKWRPDYLNGGVFAHQFSIHHDVTTPVVRQWIDLWQHVTAAAPAGLGVTTAIVETLIALGLLTGTLSNVVYVGSALYSFGIWSAAEAFGLPWSAQGATDVGPSVGYLIAALLLLACPGNSLWSVDRVLRPRLGRYRWLAGA
jgi:nitrite reductase (NO-forming)